MSDRATSLVGAGVEEQEERGVGNRGVGRGVPLEAMGAHAAVHRQNVRRRKSKLVDVINQHGGAIYPQDQALLEAVVINGCTLVDTSRLLGISAAACGRRVRALVRRLSSFEFQFAAVQRVHWSARQAAVAECCVLRGMSTREASERLHLAISLVRRARDQVTARIDGAKTAIRMMK